MVPFEGSARGDWLLGRDARPGALALARRAVKALDTAQRGLTTPVDFRLERAEEPSQLLRGEWLVCCNPPWGVRLGGPGGAAGRLARQEASSEDVLPEGSDTDGRDTEDVRLAWRALGANFRMRRREISFAWVQVPAGPRGAELVSELESQLDGCAPAKCVVVEGGPRTEAGKLGDCEEAHLQWRRYDLL